MSRRVVVHPGWISSSADKQRHYIAASTLLRLHGLPPTTPCIVLADERDRFGFRSRPDDLDLYPRYDGKYERVVP